MMEGMGKEGKRKREEGGREGGKRVGVVDQFPKTDADNSPHQ